MSEHHSPMIPSTGKPPCCLAIGTVTIGSTPLARGKYQGITEVEDIKGFIPARVGKIGCRWKMVRRAWVHPHSRGEDILWAYILPESLGSSPLAWGR